MKEKWLPVSVVTLGIILVGGCISIVHSVSTGADEVSGEVIASKLSKQNIENSISISGSVKGDEVFIGNGQSSVCVDVRVNEGDYVEAGDTLFVFDTTELQNEYDKTYTLYKAERDKADKNESADERSLQLLKDEEELALGQAQSNTDYAVKKLEDCMLMKDQLNEEKDALTNQMNDLKDKMDSEELSESQNGMMSADYTYFSERLQSVTLKISEIEESIPELERNIEVAKENYATVEAEYKAKIADAESTMDRERTQVFEVNQSDLNQLRKKIDNCVVKAPVSGVISDINACKGAIVNDSVLAMIHNNSDYHIEASVAENNISKLSAGMKVRVKTAATGDEELDGVIASISNYGNNNDNSVNYSLFIDLLDKDKTEGLMMNMTANISIIEDVVSNIYAVPYDAVLHDDGGDYVLVAVPHKDHYKLKRADVEKGTDSNFLCEINGKELKEGELVVIMPKDCNEDDIVDVNIE